MKYTRISGTGVIAHRTELTVEEKYAVIGAIEAARIVSSFKPDWSRILLQEITNLIIALVAPDDPDDVDVETLVKQINCVIASARQDESKSSPWEASDSGIRVTNALAIQAHRALEYASRLYEIATKCAQEDEDPVYSDEAEVYRFISNFVEMVKEG